MCFIRYNPPAIGFHFICSKRRGTNAFAHNFENVSAAALLMCGAGASRAQMPAGRRRMRCSGLARRRALRGPARMMRRLRARRRRRRYCRLVMGPSPMAGEFAAVDGRNWRAGDGDSCDGAGDSLGRGGISGGGRGSAHGEISTAADMERGGDAAGIIGRNKISAAGGESGMVAGYSCGRGRSYRDRHWQRHA